MNLLPGRSVMTSSTFVPRRRVGRATLLAIVAAVAVSTVASAAWDPVVPMTSDDEARLDTNHTLASSGSTVHAVYSHYISAVSSPSLTYRRSVNSGTSWSSEVILDEHQAGNTIGYEALAVAASGDVVIVLYRADSLSGSDPKFHAIYSRRSDDAGLTWASRKTLAKSTTSEYQRSRADVGLSGNHALAAWTDSDTGHVLTRRSVDGGTTWKPVIDIGTTSFDYGSILGKDGNVTVAASGARAYVAWVQGSGAAYSGLSLRRSDDGGASFAAKQTVTSAAMYGLPSITAQGQKMLLLFGLPDGTIKLARSTNGGAALTTSSVAGAASGRFAGDVAITGTKARVAYRQAGKIWTRTSNDSGATWAAAALAYDGQQVFQANVVAAGAVTVIEFLAGPDGFTTDVQARRST